MQAGGDLGAFEIGALKGMLESLPKGQLEYDVVSGKLDLNNLSSRCDEKIFLHTWE